MITTAELTAKYGTPNKTGAGYIVTIDLPYAMRIAWNTIQTTKKMQCHKLVAENFKKVFKELLEHYGLAELKRLEIDLFGGCFNYRLMRGSTTKLSTHSWGVAIDLSPDKNGLKTPIAKAQFAKPEYNKMFEIFERNGFENLGKIIQKDAMHFQIKE